MKTIVFCNQKGGVGKTTSSVNIAAALASMGHKVLIVDMDPQGNAGSGVGINKYHVEKSVYHALIGEVPLQDVIQKTEFENLYIVPSNRDLIGAEVELVNAFSRETKLKSALNSVREDFDYCLIDCPPSLNLLTVNSLTASDGVIVPVQTEYYALEGMSELVHTIELIQGNLNPELEIIGIVLTMYDSRNNLANQVSQEVRDYFKEKVFQTMIPRNVRLSESPSHGQPIQVYDEKSKGAVSYQELSKEIHERVNQISKGGLKLVQGNQ
jgi:chromosome partitioning protein